MVHHRSIVAAAILLVGSSNAFTVPSSQVSNNIKGDSCSSLYMSATEGKAAKKEGYVPKWKKLQTLADETGTGELAAEDKGLAGAVPIVFSQGKMKKGEFVEKSRIETSAMPGQPFKLVASQSGAFIKYGCGKGECGTCQSKCNGSYIKPCVDKVPIDLELDPETGKYPTLVIEVKGTRAKVVSSGKFFSVKSFLLGFWNNLLGMGGFVRDRRKAKKNYQDRIDNEDAIQKLTAEKKRKRAEEAAKNSS